MKGEISKNQIPVIMKQEERGRSESLARTGSAPLGTVNLFQSSPHRHSHKKVGGLARRKCETLFRCGFGGILPDDSSSFGSGAGKRGGDGKFR
jgi:hypothetical protein